MQEVADVQIVDELRCKTEPPEMSERRQYRISDTGSI